MSKHFTLIVVGWVVFLFTLKAMTSNSFSAEPYSGPGSLECTSSAPGAGRFELRGLGGRDVRTTLDGHVDAIDNDGLVTSIRANNGCDNDYRLSFPTAALENLAKGEVITGDMSFVHPDRSGVTTVSCSIRL
jgi:hypothetical protein